MTDQLLLPAYKVSDRLASELRTAGFWPDLRAVVQCRPDAWGRVSFAAAPVPIVGWIYDPDHSFVVSAYGFLIERNRAFACAATTRSGSRRSRVDLASRSRRFRISTSTGSSRLSTFMSSGWAAALSIVRWVYDADHSLAAGMYVDVPHLDCLLIAAPITLEGLDQLILKPKQLDAITAVYVDVVFGHLAMALSKKS